MRSNIVKLTQKYFYIGSLLFCCSYVLSSFFIAPYKDEIKIPLYLHDVMQIMFPDDFTCYYTADKEYSSSQKLFNESTLFFHEVSCERVLTLRKICALEAASRYHNNSQIVLLHTPPSEDMNNYAKVLKVLNLDNVELSRINIESYSVNTPFVNACRRWLNRIKSYKIANNIMMLLTLYKFGGTVIDSDLILTQSVKEFKSNWVTKEEDNALGLGIISFDTSEMSKQIIGNVLTALTLPRYSTETSSRELLTAEFIKLCDIQNNVSIKPDTCKGYKIIGPEAFYPINRTSKDLYYQPGKLPEDVMGFRLWDNGEKRRSIHANSLLVKIAKSHCPNVYKNFISEFINSN